MYSYHIYNTYSGKQTWADSIETQQKDAKSESILFATYSEFRRTNMYKNRLSKFLDKYNK